MSNRLNAWETTFFCIFPSSALSWQAGKSPFLRHTSLDVLFFHVFSIVIFVSLWGVIYIYIHDISILGGFKPTHPKNRGRLDPNTSLHQGGCAKVGDWLGAWELSRGGFLSFVLKRFDVEHKHEILIDVDDYWELWLNLTYCMKHDRYRCIVV